MNDSEVNVYLRFKLDELKMYNESLQKAWSI